MSLSFTKLFMYSSTQSINYRAGISSTLWGIKSLSTKSFTEISDSEPSIPVKFKWSFH